MEADYSLDCIGLYCPMPIVKTVEKIKQLKAKEVLEVLADDKGFVGDIKDWCDMTGNECLAVEENCPEIRAYIRKKS